MTHPAHIDRHELTQAVLEHITRPGTTDWATAILDTLTTTLDLADRAIDETAAEHRYETALHALRQLGNRGPVNTFAAARNELLNAKRAVEAARIARTNAAAKVLNTTGAAR